MPSTDLDVLIVGAGISGIGAACRLQEKCPRKTFAVLEARERLGGTWDLFRFPGIRSDSDMYTLGYPFRPWTGRQSIAGGASILAYVRETAEAHGIAPKIRYGWRVERAAWSSDAALWTVDANGSDGARLRLRCRFLLMCTGYYDHEAGYTPEFPGRDRYTGRVVHPQSWTPDIDYAGRRVIVIGSGATAITIVPELAKRAAHVTMLQRSPTYILSMPERDVLAEWMHQKLPARHASAATRWKNVGLGIGFYAFCRRFPDAAKRLLVAHVRRHVGETVDVATHFTPTYRPWDQRLCAVPDADLFRAIRKGTVSVVTDRIDTFTERGIRVASGAELPADLVVSATGLNLKVAGGAELVVDGKPVVPAEHLVYRGTMFSDVPNMALSIGYANASWTLKSDLTSQYVCRLLDYMDAHGYTRCCPRGPQPPLEGVPVFDLSSGYVRRAMDQLPRQGTVAPWTLHGNYALDRFSLQHARLDAAMEFGA